MWKYRIVGDRDNWIALSEESGKTINSLVAWLGSGINAGLLPLTTLGDRTFAADGGQIIFKFDGVMPNGDTNPIKMTADFTLDELEEAKSFIAKIS